MLFFTLMFVTVTYLIMFIGQWRLANKARKEVLRLKRTLQFKTQKQVCSSKGLNFRLCVIAAGKCSMIEEDGLSGFAVIDLEIYQNMLLELGREAEAEAYNLQSLIDKAKAKAFCSIT